MHTQKLRDLAFLQLELRQQQAKKGLVRDRLKRSLGKSAPSHPPSKTASKRPGSLEDVAIVEEVGHELARVSDSETSEDENQDVTVADKDDRVTTKGGFASLVDEYKSDGESDAEDRNSHSAVVTNEPARPSRALHVFLGQQRSIPIAKLFNWDVEDGWDKYWFAGLKNCRQEMEFYELVLTAEEEMRRKSSSEQSSVAPATATVPRTGASSLHPIVISDAL